LFLTLVRADFRSAENNIGKLIKTADGLATRRGADGASLQAGRKNYRSSNGSR